MRNEERVTTTNERSAVKKEKQRPNDLKILHSLVAIHCNGKISQIWTRSFESELFSLAVPRISREKIKAACDKTQKYVNKMEDDDGC